MKRGQDTGFLEYVVIAILIALVFAAVLFIFQKKVLP